MSGHREAVLARAPRRASTRAKADADRGEPITVPRRESAGNHADSATRAFPSAVNRPEKRRAAEKVSERTGKSPPSSISLILFAPERRGARIVGFSRLFPWSYRFHEAVKRFEGIFVWCEGILCRDIARATGFLR